MERRRMLDVIGRMRRARIGSPKEWDRVAGKVESDLPLSPSESEYYARMTRIYRDPGAAGAGRRSYHYRLSKLDDKPKCALCGEESEYYCNMNDQYFCQAHLAGHDPNE